VASARAAEPPDQRARPGGGRRRKGGKAAEWRRQPVGRRGAAGTKGMEKKRLHAAGRAIKAAALVPPAVFPLWCVPFERGDHAASARRGERMRTGKGGFQRGKTDGGKQRCRRRPPRSGKAPPVETHVETAHTFPAALHSRSRWRVTCRADSWRRTHGA